MRALGVVDVEPGIEGSLEFLQAAPVLSPDEFGLEGQDEPFHHGVAGRTAHGGVCVLECQRQHNCSQSRPVYWGP
jgi:hypothetical protein